MDSIFKSWEKKLSDFADSVEKDLEEVRQCKAEIQRMKVESIAQELNGRYIRDDRRLILSAPEIIIGNVDMGGALYENEDSAIVIRGTQVGVQGAGDSGTVEMRAPFIRQIAENPGSDGNLHIVGGISEISSQAHNIILQSDDVDGVFPAPPQPAIGGGVRIHSDHALELTAAKTAESREKMLTDAIAVMEGSKDSLKQQMESHKSAFEDLVKQVDELLNEKEQLGTDSDSLRKEFLSIEAKNDDIKDLSIMIAEEVYSYRNVLSMLAETNRQITCLKAEKDKVVKGEDFKTKSTDASVSIQGEVITMASVDGEGNRRVNDNAGVNVISNRFSVSATEDGGKLMENGNISLTAKSVGVNTISVTNQEYDDKGAMTKANYAVEGDFTVNAKNVSFTGVDYELADKKFKEKALNTESTFNVRTKTVIVSTEGSAGMDVDDKGKVTKVNYTADGDVIIKAKTFTVAATDNEVANSELKEKALTKDSVISLRAEKMDFSATDTEGKATGSLSLNAKAVAVKSMDVEKEKRTDDKLAAGSTMVLVSEKMYVGAKSKDVKSKKVQAVSEELALIADKTLEAQQDKKAIVQLSGGNLSVGGSKTAVYGDTTINAKAEIKGEVKAPKATIDNLEAKSSFKSQNISDGIAVPGAGGGGSLSAKMEQEDAPKE